MGVLEPGEQSGHPGIALAATATEHEDVWDAPSPSHSVQLYAITYARMATAEQTAASPEALGARVRALREAMDLSLRDLAERSGVSAPMLSQVERGETSPTLQVATRIASGLDLRLSQLLRLDEDGAVTVVRKRERRKGPTG